MPSGGRGVFPAGAGPREAPVPVRWCGALLAHLPPHPPRPRRHSRLPSVFCPLPACQWGCEFLQDPRPRTWRPFATRPSRGSGPRSTGSLWTVVSFRVLLPGGRGASRPEHTGLSGPAHPPAAGARDGTVPAVPGEWGVPTLKSGSCPRRVNAPRRCCFSALGPP